MEIKLHYLFLLVVITIIEISLAKNSVKTKLVTGGHKENNSPKDKSSYNRIKRSIDDDETPFWPNRGRRFTNLVSRFHSDLDNKDKEPPFWGARGRRDSSSELYLDDVYTPLATDSKRLSSKCKHCSTLSETDDIPSYEPKERREESSIPFWGNRGRRTSDESDDDNLSSDTLWGNRVVRRHESDPFWGARGRREEETPFWGNRGRRDEEEPFWGNRGRRQEDEPFWGSRGRRENKNNHKETFKDVLKDAISKVEDNIENLIRSRRGDNASPNTFWNNRGRESKIKYLFQGGRNKFKPYNFLNANSLEAKPSESSTVHDDRIFAEQPRFILVDRSSRSSSEDDPFYISRGKKKFVNYNYIETSRNRRGALEEFVKTVRNDPYYIARGKKDLNNTDNGNSTTLQKELGKAKELICATIELVLIEKEANKAKREISDNDRDRRTTLKKLAAQLQVDPYFVSRGKKNESDFNEDNLEDFINEVSSKCS